MKNFWGGFFKSAEEDRLHPAAVAGAAGAAGTARGLYTNYQITKKHRAAKSSKNWRSFIKQLKPGDVITSTPTKSREKIVKGVNLKDALTLFGESPQTHAALYTGKGALFEIPGSKYRASVSSAKTQLSRGENVVAYRPTNNGKALSQKQKARAIASAKELSGRKYETAMENVKRVGKTVAGIGGKSCNIGKGGRIVCTDVIAKAYPKQIPNRYTSIGAIERSKHMQPVAKLIRARPGMRTKLIHNVLRPAARGAKWALPAYGAAKALDYIKGKKNEPI